MKSTYQEVSPVNGDMGADSMPKGINIFKDPITDDGTKKSAKGLLKVASGNVYPDGGNDPKKAFVLFDECTWKQEDQGALQTIFEDGEFSNIITLDQIRTKLGSL
jgi:nicotinamide phosphoribosyltransferase